jgi:hypothetical protein
LESLGSSFLGGQDSFIINCGGSAA